MGKEEAAKREAEAKARAEAEAKAKAADGKTPVPGGQAPRAPGVPERSSLPDSDRATLYSGPTIVDDDKVADALKKLRSLDDAAPAPSANVSLSVLDASSAEVTRVAAPGERARPMTPVPTTPTPAPVSRMQTTTPAGKSGTLWGWMPSQESSEDSGRTPAPPARTPVASEVTSNPPPSEAARQTAQRSGLLGGGAAAPAPADAARASKPAPRPTAIGHSTSTPVAGSAVGQPAADDRAFKGTMHGHSLHLPDDALEVTEDSKPRAASTPAGNPTAHAPALIAPATDRGLSQRSSGVVEAQPARPRKVEARRRRPKAASRAVIFVAVVSTFVVGAFAWVRFHHPEPADPPPTALQQLEQEQAEPAGAVPTAPPPAGTAVPGEPPAPTPVGSAAPADEPSAIPPSTGEPGSLVPSAAVDKIARPVRPDQLVHELPRAEGKKVDRHGTRRPPAAVEPTPRTTRAPAPPTKPAGKGKRDDDPDGTLPLAE